MPVKAHVRVFNFSFISVEMWFLLLLNLIFCFAELEIKSGKTAVITGGTRGIGLEVIKMLLQCDMNVVIGKIN